MKKLLFIAVVVVAAGAAGWWFFPLRSAAPAAGVEAKTSYTVPALTKPYTNDTYRFSLQMPEDFSAREVASEEGGHTLVIEDKSGNGIQIIITSFNEDLKVLTKERVLQDVPDLTITDEQSVEIGQDHKGLAFKSDNLAFDGDSREAWFVYPECSRGVCRGNLYQISTYARLDPLLQAIFATWRFF